MVGGFSRGGGSKSLLYMFDRVSFRLVRVLWLF